MKFAQIFYSLRVRITSRQAIEHQTIFDFKLFRENSGNAGLVQEVDVF